jgi:hypothetical protein
VSAATLPAPFAHLDPWLPFALPSEDARMRRRLAASMDELTGLYRALVGELPAIAAHLDQWPLAELPAEQKPLLYLAMSFMEARWRSRLSTSRGRRTRPRPRAWWCFRGGQRSC